MASPLSGECVANVIWTAVSLLSVASVLGIVRTVAIWTISLCRSWRWSRCPVAWLMCSRCISARLTTPREILGAVGSCFAVAFLARSCLRAIKGIRLSMNIWGTRLTLSLGLGIGCRSRLASSRTGSRSARTGTGWK